MLQSPSVSYEPEDSSPKSRLSSFPKMRKEESSPSRISATKDLSATSLPRSKTIINNRNQKSFYGKASVMRANNNQHSKTIDFNNMEDFEVEKGKINLSVFF